MAATDRNSFADVWEQLDAKYAERVRVTDAAALGDEEIVRRWPQIGEGYLSKCLTALSLFTDSKNSKPQLWVKDPVVGRETFPGIYRVVTVDVDVQKPGLKGIIQTLRKGFAETPQWTEARIERKIAALSNTVGVSGISGTTSDPVDQVFEILFPNCSPLAIESIASALRTGNYASGITVRGETHSGAWHVLSVSTKIEEDGSATATLRLATPQYTITAYDDYGLDRAMDVHYVMDVPKDQAQGIVSAWKSANAVGASATVSYSRDQKLVDIILRKTAAVEDGFDIGLSAADCRYTESETIYLNVAMADAYPIVAPTDGGGISYTRNVTRNINGTWDITIKARTIRYRDSGAITVEESAAQTTAQRQQLGLTYETPQAVVSTEGAIVSQRVEIRDDCSKDITTTTETGKPLVTTEKTVARSYEETTTSTQTASVEVPPPTQATGYVKTARNEQSKYTGRWNVMERIRRILHIPSAVTYDSRDDAAAHEQVEESVGVPNAGGTAVVLSAEAGTSLSARVRYDKESDTLDVEKTTESCKEQAEFGSSETNLDESTETVKVNVTAELAPAAAPGQAVSFKIEPTKYAGKHVVRKTVRTGKPVSVETEVSNNLEIVKEQKSLSTDASVDPVVLAGQIVEVDKRASQYKDKFDVDVRIKTAIPKTDISTSESNLETERTERKMSVDPEVPPVAAAGQIVEFQREPSRYKDKINVVIRTQTGVPHEIATEVANNLETVRKERAQSVPSPTAPVVFPGQMVEFDKRPSRYKDRFDVSKTTRIGKEKTVSFTVNNETETETVTEKMATVDAAPAVPIIGQSVDFDKKPSQYKDRFNIRQIVRTGISRIIGGSSGWISHYDGSRRRYLKKTMLNVPESEIPVANEKGMRVDVSPAQYKGFVNVEQTKVVVEPWFIDFDEPTTTGKHPRFNRKIFWLADSRTIPSYVNVFLAKVAAVVDEQYSITASVSRDENGYYNVDLQANPLRAGGSASDWDTGAIAFDIPWCEARSKYLYAKAEITMTNSAIKVRQLLNNASANLIEHGAGETTGVYYMGRGRYKVVLCYGSDTKT